jgi:serine/threonine protein kinase
LCAACVQTFLCFDHRQCLCGCEAGGESGIRTRPFFKPSCYQGDGENPCKHCHSNTISFTSYFSNVAPFNSISAFLELMELMPGGSPRQDGSTEYISGQTLDEKLATGGLSEKEVVSLGRQLAQGLSAAHEQDIVHRDLKPANLRLTSDGRLKILDFGLAQLMPHTSEVGMTATLTQSQEVTGTLPYMAPEQLRGEPAEARTDVWAAGAVLYEMATAHRPFEQKVPSALTDDIIHNPPLPPRRLRSELSPKLEAVILNPNHSSREQL